MSDVIEALKAERNQLRKKLAKIEAAIHEYERWTRSVAELVGDGRVPALEDSDDDTGLKQTPMREFEDAVRELLGQADAPLRRNQVYEELVKAGVVVGGKEPLNTVASRLSRMEKIINLKGFGYWPEERPYAPAGHPKEMRSAPLFDRSNTAPDEQARVATDAENFEGEA